MAPRRSSAAFARGDRGFVQRLGFSRGLDHNLGAWHKPRLAIYDDFLSRLQAPSDDGFLANGSHDGNRPKFSGPIVHYDKNLLPFLPYTH